MNRQSLLALCISLSVSPLPALALDELVGESQPDQAKDAIVAAYLLAYNDLTWAIDPLDKAIHGPQAPVQEQYPTEPLHEIYARFVASLRLSPILAHLLHTALISEASDEEVGIVVCSAERPKLEQYLNRHARNLAGSVDSLDFRLCEYLNGNEEADVYLSLIERSHRAMARSLVHSALSIRHHVVLRHRFLQLDESDRLAFESGLNQRHQHLVETIAELFKQSQFFAALDQESQAMIQNRGLPIAIESAHDWLADRYQFMPTTMLTEQNYLVFLNHTRDDFETIVTRISRERAADMLEFVPLIVATTIVSEYAHQCLPDLEHPDPSRFPITVPDDIEAFFTSKTGLKIDMQYPGVPPANAEPSESELRVRHAQIPMDIFSPSLASRKDFCLNHFSLFRGWNRFLDGRPDLVSSEPFRRLPDSAKHP